MESQSLLQTEQTDAVNSGIVGRADKSGSALKGNLYSVGKKGVTGGAASAALSAVTKGRKARAADAAEAAGSEHDGTSGASNASSRAASRAAASRRVSSRKGASPASTVGGENAADAATAAQTKRHLGDSLKKGAKAGAKGAAVGTVTGKALEGTELEGADDLYYKGRGTYRAARGIRRRMSGRDALDSEKSLGALSEKKARQKAADVAEVQRRKQAAGYFKSTVYTTAEKAKVAASTAKSGILFIGGEVKGLLGAVSTIGAPIILGAIAVILIVAVLAAILGGAADDEESQSAFGNLTGVQLEVAQALREEGLGNAQIAAIMGNISGESGWDTNAEYHGEGNNYAYEYGYGLFQFTDTSRGSGEYTNFVNWCNANGKEKSSAAAQTQYFIQNLRYSWSTGLHRSGYYTKYITEYAGMDASYDAWLNTSDVGFATYCVMACWLRPADWAARDSFYSTRLPEAQAFYEQLTSGGNGQEYAASDATQRAIVDAAKRTPTTGAGWCAAWVSNVYQNAGLGYVGGNACCMYLNYCTSSDRSELKVGMIIAVQESPTSYGNYNNGHNGYGHVGIYIGDNKVMHNTGTVQTTDLDEWIAQYSTRSEARWGFPPNVSQ